MVRGTAIGLIVFILLFGNYSFANLFEAIKYYGFKIFPSQPDLGTLFFFLILFYILFTDNVNKFFKKIFKNVKRKD